jgi:hypothetical protein
LGEEDDEQTINELNKPRQNAKEAGRKARLLDNPCFKYR